MSQRRRPTALLGLAVLLALSGALVEESLVHTDDGCPLEIHCLACRLAVGTTAEAGAFFAAPTTPVFEEAGVVARAPRSATQDPASDRAVPRGPPLT